MRRLLLGFQQLKGAPNEFRGRGGERREEESCIIENDFMAHNLTMVPQGHTMDIGKGESESLSQGLPNHLTTIIANC